MSIVSEVKKLYTIRDNVYNVIRSKGIEVPEGTKLRELPDYMTDLVKENTSEDDSFTGDWTEELSAQHILEAKIAYESEMTKYTGHVDEEGLRAIGWSDADITYFQTYGIDWMEEDDDQYLVSDYEKDLYTSGALYTGFTATATTSNTPEMVEWRNNIRWMPKFTAANVSFTFRNFEKMIGCPFFSFANATSGQYMFSYCRELRCAPVIFFKPNTAWTAANMFQYCEKLRVAPSLDWSYCSSLSNAFRGCTNLMYVPNLNISEKCTTLTYAFYNCLNLRGIESITSGTLLNNIACAFENCKKLKSVPMFNTANVTNFQEAFANCYEMVAIPNFNVAKVTNFANTFRNCKSLIKLPDMNFGSGVTTYASMCQYCTSLKSVPTTLDFTATTSIGNMFDFCDQLTEWPYKLNLNAVAANATEGIKTASQFISNCKIKKIEFGKFYFTSAPSAFRWCTDLEEIWIDDFAGGTKFADNCTLENMTELKGELRGINKSLSFSGSVLPALSKESILRILNAAEDVTGQATAPTLTFGESLRILTTDEKAIATSKGWVLK